MLHLPLQVLYYPLKWVKESGEVRSEEAIAQLPEYKSKA